MRYVPSILRRSSGAPRHWSDLDQLAGAIRMALTGIYAEFAAGRVDPARGELLRARGAVLIEASRQLRAGVDRRRVEEFLLRAGLGEVLRPPGDSP